MTRSDVIAQMYILQLIRSINPAEKYLRLTSLSLSGAQTCSLLYLILAAI